MKIGIELNNIVRDINSQIIKYYKRDVNDNANEEFSNLNYTELIDSLKFKSKKDKDNFIYVDYAYEIFGCAKQSKRNLVNAITDWEIKLNNLDDGNKYEITHFSLHEIALTIQSTYYFLSKIGSRVRRIFFPKKPSDIWSECDVVITINKDVIKSKPKNKVSVLIKTDSNDSYSSKADIVYNDLFELMNDSLFISKVNEKLIKKDNMFRKVKNNLLKIFKHGN